MTELSLPLLAFVSVALLVLAAAPRRERTVRQRLAPYGRRAGMASPARERALAGSFLHRVLRPVVRSGVAMVSSATPTGIRERALLELARAGDPVGVDTYLAIRGVAMLGLPLTAILFFTRGSEGMTPLGLVMVAGLFLAGRRVTSWWIGGRVTARQGTVERSLPGALDLVTVCMEAGLSFDAGLAKMVEKTRGPLADGFARVLQEMQIGKPRREALRDLARRTQVRDLSTFVAAVAQADQMGMSLAPVMRAQADEVRTRRRQRAEEQAMKAPVKMLFPLIFCILPATMLVVLGPAVVTLFTQILVQMAEF